MIPAKVKLAMAGEENGGQRAYTSEPGERRLRSLSPAQVTRTRRVAWRD